MLHQTGSFLCKGGAKKLLYPLILLLHLINVQASEKEIYYSDEGLLKIDLSLRYLNTTGWVPVQCSDTICQPDRTRAFSISPGLSFFPSRSFILGLAVPIETVEQDFPSGSTLAGELIPPRSNLGTTVSPELYFGYSINIKQKFWFQAQFVIGANTNPGAVFSGLDLEIGFQMSEYFFFSGLRSSVNVGMMPLIQFQPIIGASYLIQL